MKYGLHRGFALTLRLPFCIVLLCAAGIGSAQSDYPECEFRQSDSDGDGYGWENNRSCVVSMAQQPSGHPDCQSARSDPDGDGFGWENNRSCRVVQVGGPATSTLPECRSADSDPDGDGFGWEANRSCRVVLGVDPPSSTLPNCDSASSDSDGDGFGWENNTSCRIANGPASLANIFDTVVAQGLGSFARSISLSGLYQMLADPAATYTVFAPTDQAIRQLSISELRGLGVWLDNNAEVRFTAAPGTLDSFLLNHVVSGRTIDYQAVVDLSGTTLTSMSGGQLSIEVVNGELRINGVGVTTRNIRASNGIIHVIDTVVKDCSDSAKDEWVYRNMLDAYYHADRVDSSIDFNNYDASDENPVQNALVKQMRVERFSEVRNRNQSELNSRGMLNNLGYGLRRDDQQLLRFVRVYENSPAGLAGIKRGDIWVAINGVPIDDVGDRFVSFLGTPDTPIQATYTVADSVTGQPRDVPIRYIDGGYVRNTVMAATTYSDNAFDTEIGYLVFDSFNAGVSGDELNDAMDYFKQIGVGELILDLRYNGGGHIEIAEKLIGQISGRGNGGQVLAFDTVFNDRFATLNERTHVRPQGNSLDLDRVIVIVSGNTASSSELVINALRGLDIETVIVGEGFDSGGMRSLAGSTVGKPYTSYPMAKCDIELNPMLAVRVNAKGQSVAGGIVPDCPVFDDYKSDWGFNAVGVGKHEVMLATAYRYLLTGSCPAGGSKVKRREPARLSGSDDDRTIGLLGGVVDSSTDWQ